MSDGKLNNESVTAEPTVQSDVDQANVAKKPANRRIKYLAVGCSAMFCAIAVAVGIKMLSGSVHSEVPTTDPITYVRSDGTTMQIDWSSVQSTDNKQALDEFLPADLSDDEKEEVKVLIQEAKANQLTPKLGTGSKRQPASTPTPKPTATPKSTSPGTDRATPTPGTRQPGATETPAPTSTPAPTATPKPDHPHPLKYIPPLAATHKIQGHISYYVCETCGKLFSDRHGWNQIRKEDTVTTNDHHDFSGGWRYNKDEHYKVCSCGAVGEKTKHKWIKEVIEEPTCVKEGYFYRECSVCKYIDTGVSLEMSKIPHKMMYSPEEPATHTQNGMIEYWKCSSCERFFKDKNGETEIIDEKDLIIPATGHDWDRNVENIEYGSDEKLHWMLCSCGKMGEAESHVIEDVFDVEPTCSTYGIKHTACKICGRVFQTELPAEYTAHELTFVEGRPATHEGAGVLPHYECTKCGQCFADKSAETPVPAASVVIPAGNHEYSEKWNSNDQMHWHACSCGAQKDLGQHAFGEIIVERETSCAKTGLKYQECTICGYKHVTETPKLSHQLLEYPKDYAVFDPDGEFIPVSQEEADLRFWYCKVCKQYFSDASCTKVIENKDLPTALLYSDTKYDKYIRGEYTATEPAPYVAPTTPAPTVEPKVTEPATDQTTSP